jgi:hypothetical protein
MITPKEIIERATQFSKDWKDATRENSDKQTFWNEFFYVFGIDRKKVAKFEETVKKYSGKSGFVDLFWKGELIVEHKSKGEDLDDAYDQAVEYADGLKKRDRPKYIVVSDFDVFRIYDCGLNESKYEEIKLSDFPKKTDSFGFISGYSRRKYKEEEPVNKDAAELIGNLHEAMVDSGYKGEDLERFLVRILFCLFADDTTIFQPKGIFREFIDEDTYEDGSNVGSQLIHLFQVLNTPEEKRQRTLSEKLKAFPYVNGDLFAERLETPSFDKKMRDVLLECCQFDWSEISPAIFGTMFQAIIHGAKRDELGAHYTSEGNIMKVIHGLFLDELLEEFAKVQKSLNRLKEFHNKIAELKFFDPACGCGNFLVIAYREMRRLEIDILKQERTLDRGIQLSLDVLKSQIRLESFYGIEYDKSAVRITEVALWLMEHKMNEEVTREFSKYVPTIPLQASPNITCGNALRIDWNKTISKEKLSFVFGNPPFVSQENRTTEQREDMKLVFGDGGAVLDYVCAWYKKAADYIEDTNIKAAFVSTNSITQGEQVGVLWEYLFKQNIKIHFAHRTFKWNNEAKGKASVYVVIIGFATFDTDKKFIYDYLTPKSEPEEIKVKKINPYLIEFDDVIITDRNTPISDVPKMYKGSQPTDGGNFLFSDQEKKEFLKAEPKAKKFIKPFLSSKEFINGMKRWCLWLVDAEPEELRGLPEVMKRVAGVKAMRLKSTKPATVKWAARPKEFTENRQPNANYILVPRHSSENRDYVPMGFFTKNDIAGDSCSVIPNASLFLFGVINSTMHMTWLKQVCGRIKSDFRYSNTIVYNNFPFPESVSEKNKKNVTEKAESVLNARNNHPNSSLADLYDPDTMPEDLRKAHNELNKAVDNCYGKQVFKTEMERLKFLFGLYQKKIEPLLTETTSKKSKTKSKAKA